jgi:hypothetical protein
VVKKEMKNFELQAKNWPNWPKFGQQMGQNSAAKWAKIGQQMGRNSAAKWAEIRPPNSKL